MKKIINSPSAPKSVGPYNQAVQSGNFIFLAGQIPLDPKTGKIVEGGVKEQTAQILANIQAVLIEAGSSLEKVVKATVFMKDLKDFAVMNEVYAAHFPAKTAPVRSTVEVARLPMDVLVEIEVIAERE